MCRVRPRQHGEKSFTYATLLALFSEQRECFWVKHYAGKVKYTVEGWVERNMDRVPPSFHDTLHRSTHKVRTNL